MGKVTVPNLTQMKRDRKKIVALTCYDFSTARLLNEAGVDLLLVGDSLGMVKLGHSSTLPVTVEDMLYHTRIVARANQRALLVTDMPFLSYQASSADAVRHAGVMLKAGAEAVKLEGGKAILPQIKALRAAQIPVIGHLGLTPQSVHSFGGYKVQGRSPKAAKAIVEDARALERSGVSALVLEGIPSALARRITRLLRIPTIGIGAGPHCDGQVLVIDDLIGLTPSPYPRFVKAYADAAGLIRSAAVRYAQEVRTGRFPDGAHSYT